MAEARTKNFICSGLWLGLVGLFLTVVCLATRGWSVYSETNVTLSSSGGETAPSLAYNFGVVTYSMSITVNSVSSSTSGDLSSFKNIVTGDGEGQFRAASKFALAVSIIGIIVSLPFFGICWRIYKSEVTELHYRYCHNVAFASAVFLCIGAAGYVLIRPGGGAFWSNVGLSWSYIGICVASAAFAFATGSIIQARRAEFLPADIVVTSAQPTVVLVQSYAGPDGQPAYQGQQPQGSYYYAAPAAGYTAQHQPGGYAYGPQPGTAHSAYLPPADYGQGAGYPTYGAQPNPVAGQPAPGAYAYSAYTGANAAEMSSASSGASSSSNAKL